MRHDGGERDLEGVRDLGVREADDVAEQERHLEIDGEGLDGAPDGVDRLRPLERLVDDLERRDVVQRDDARGRRSSARSSSSTRFFVTWKSRREPRAVGESREPLVRPQEDLLRQILGETAVADEATRSCRPVARTP
jgi:hypothetical protein